MDKSMISTTEAAKIMGISRIAVWKKISQGKLKAVKIGRNYVIDRRDLGGIYSEMTPETGKTIDKTVDRIIKEYGDALNRLGKE